MINHQTCLPHCLHCCLSSCTLALHCFVCCHSAATAHTATCHIHLPSPLCVLTTTHHMHALFLFAFLHCMHCIFFLFDKTHTMHKRHFSLEGKEQDKMEGRKEGEEQGRDLLPATCLPTPLLLAYSPAAFYPHTPSPSCLLHPPYMFCAVVVVVVLWFLVWAWRCGQKSDGRTWRGVWRWNRRRFCSIAVLSPPCCLPCNICSALPFLLPPHAARGLSPTTYFLSEGQATIDDMVAWLWRHRAGGVGLARGVAWASGDGRRR